MSPAESITGCSVCHSSLVCPLKDAVKRPANEKQNNSKIKSGETIYSVSSRFQGLYVVKAGFVKRVSFLENGKFQISGFYMKGEIFGFDGLKSDRHTSTAIAIENSELCKIQIDWIKDDRGNGMEPIDQFCRIMSDEIDRYQHMTLLLGAMSAEERLAKFILELSKKLDRRGYSPINLVLRMSRRDIGSYLSMKVETVSRLFSAFQNKGLLRVRNRNVQIIDEQGLRKLVEN